MHDIPPPPAQYSPATERNRQPILDALLRLLPASGTALEIASGTGQHVAFFASHMPGWHWQPSDRTGEGFASIAAWCAHHRATQVQAPVVLDVTADQWPADGSHSHSQFPAGGVDAIFCANMLHIAPWAACGGLMRGAARHLAPNGQLLTYGPYLEQDVVTSAGNLAFDASLQQRNAAWGIRALNDVAAQAEAVGLRLMQRLAMPANNLLLVWAQAR